MYVMHAIMSRALQTEFDNKNDPVTEVAAPDTFQARDLGIDLGGQPPA
jgi:hypothetical protein